MFLNYLHYVCRPKKKESWNSSLIYMDLARTFDSLNYELLIAKIKCYRLDQHAVEPFRSYLSNRYQSCKINNSLGDWRKIIAVVPQGSALGVLLFNIFLSIFFFLKDAYLGNYADDSTFYGYNKNLKTIICNLRQEFSILSKWFYDSYMMLNPGKSHFMFFGVKETEQFDLICNSITLKHISHEKILGVTIDNERINNICKTANKNLNAVSRISHCMKQNQKEIFCHPS